MGHHDDCCSLFHLCCYICSSCYSGGTLDWQITIQLPVLSLALWMVLFCYQYTTGEREGWCARGLCSWKCFCLKACIIVWYIGTSVVSRAMVVTGVMDSKVHTFNLHCVVFDPSEVSLALSLSLSLSHPRCLLLNMFLLVVGYCMSGCSLEQHCNVCVTLWVVWLGFTVNADTPVNAENLSHPNLYTFEGSLLQNIFHLTSFSFDLHKYFSKK